MRGRERIREKRLELKRQRTRGVGTPVGLPKITRGGIHETGIPERRRRPIIKMKGGEIGRCYGGLFCLLAGQRCDRAPNP